MSTPSEWLTILEASQRLGVSPKTVRRWIQAGRLPARKEKGPYGEQYLVPAEAIQSAQQVIDVVKVERPTDPRVLALAVAQAIEEREGALRQELAALRAQVAALATNPAWAQENAALRDELAGLQRQLTTLISAVEQSEQARREQMAQLETKFWEGWAQLAERLPAPPEQGEKTPPAERERRRWWQFWGRRHESPGTG
ncbi:MAG TPA: helix-turn-helix domain-containing protein [Dehalococcoidia bacterium]|nr:helix-turn-helix domain-containing protein [Dehalococcoidia bacterium]